MAIRYEWDVETCVIYSDGIEDVFEHNHAQYVNDLVQYLQKPRLDPEGQGTLITRLVLVRDVFDDDIETLVHRSWAYAQGKTLPKTFDDGYRVPLRFHYELAKALFCEVAA